MYVGVVDLNENKYFPRILYAQVRGLSTKL